MTIFFLTLGIMITVIVAMSVGVIFQNKPIKGSCGGLNAIGLGGKCDICGSDTRCEKPDKNRISEVQRQKAGKLAKNVMDTQRAN